jgi:hypothetical protein
LGGGAISWREIVGHMQGVQPQRVRGALTQLRDADILIEEGADAWRFNSSLFRRWLARNPWDGWSGAEDA